MVPNIRFKGFDGEWKSIQPYTGGSSTNVGTTPEGWCIANVAGYQLFVDTMPGAIFFHRINR